MLTLGIDSSTQSVKALVYSVEDKSVVTTVFAAMPAFRTDPDGCGHVFGNPSGGFMSLACFKNGSLAREKVRTMVGCDYRFFDETAFESAAGFKGRAFPYFEEEITPKHEATGIEADFRWDAASDAEKVVSVVRGQVLTPTMRGQTSAQVSTHR